MRPKTVEVINNILAIVWEDGHESYFEWEALRRACPCALCKGETNVMVEYKPSPPKYTPASFEMTRWEYVGAYALQPHWADGHNSGIYAFPYLRAICPCDPCIAKRIPMADKP